MKAFSRRTRGSLGRRGWAVASVVLAAWASAPASADTLWVTAGTQASAAAIELRDVRVLRIEDGKVIFRSSASGNESSRDVATVRRMAIDDEPALTSAEAAFAGEQFDKATDDYLRAQRATTRPWLRPWIAGRLMASATRAGRFDAMASAYVELVQTDPRVARDNRPPIDPASPPKPGMLDAAAETLDRAIARPSLPADQKQALLQFQLDIHRARGDNAKAAKVLEQLVAMGGAAPGAAAGKTNAPDPNAAKALAEVRLSQAQAALEARDFAKAAATVEQHRATFTEPRQQAEALYLLAVAREGEARAAKDKTRLRDAALAYMRVVAHFRDIPGAAGRVPASMLRTAVILEELGEKSEARALYRELTEGTDAAVKEPARQGLDRLK